jgi:hypothetical protein
LVKNYLKVFTILLMGINSMFKGRRPKITYQIPTRMIILFTIFMFVGASFVPLSSAELTIQTTQTYQSLETSSMIIEGQILYSPMYTSTTYLRENTGTLNHTWSSSFLPGCMVRWVGDGSIMRTIRVGVGPGGGGAGGGVQKLEWDGTVTWDFRYNTNGVLSHHDICVLPNGNVLLVAWEQKTKTECIAAGRNPSYVTNNGLLPDHVIEVQPTGPSSGTIVWEWHVWNHLIQDYDSSKTNYGVVSNHPELVDINFVTSSAQDLMHSNSIDYNEQFDQVMISVRYYSEIWVIDHSTTTAEAAGHTGGNSGKGGDLLYRWGNPQAYDRGTSSNRKLYEQHDTQWIDEDFPGEGNILIFNNGVGRHYSTVEEIVPPVDENGNYYLESGSAFGPTTPVWQYNPTPSFYASHLSGADRLPSGNTLVCNGEAPGKLFEVTPDGTKVWEYNGFGEVLKIDYVPPVIEQPEPPENNTPDLDCTGSLSWMDLEPGATVNGTFQIHNIGDNDSLLNWTIVPSSITWGTWSFTPESGEDLTPADGLITVHVSVVAPNEEDTVFQGGLRIENVNDSTDYDVVPVYLKTPLETHTTHLKMNLRTFFFLIVKQWSLFIEQRNNFYSFL